MTAQPLLNFLLNHGTLHKGAQGVHRGVVDGGLPFRSALKPVQAVAPALTLSRTKPCSVGSFVFCTTIARPDLIARSFAPTVAVFATGPRSSASQRLRRRPSAGCARRTNAGDHGET